tara:strand:+ start:76 stop:312 length:237 start_codon:yes stop_codon:yes gene_type:complete
MTAIALLKIFDGLVGLVTLGHFYSELESYTYTIERNDKPTFLSTLRYAVTVIKQEGLFKDSHLKIARDKVLREQGFGD